MKNQLILALAKKGMHLVPWKNRKAEIRKPLWANWTGETPSIESVQGALDQYPAADWAVVPKGYVVIDCDVKNGHNGIEVIKGWYTSAGKNFEEETKRCAVVKTFSNGRHFYFKYSGNKSTVNAGHGVEFKCRNSSVHVPPSEGYSWLQEIGSIEELPELPSFIEARWTKTTEEGLRDYKRQTYANGERRLMLCSIAAALRNCSLNSDELLPALKAVAKQRCAEPMDDGEIEQIAKDFGVKDIGDIFGSALAGCEVSKGILRFAIGANNDVIVPATPVTDVAVVPQPTMIDRSITHPNEMLGAWVDCVDFNNPMNQPIYGLASAIAGIGTLMGRRYVCNGAYANQYIVILGATSTGKNAPLSCLKAILRSIKADHLIAASKIASGAGMINELATKNELIWTIDELAFLLRGLAARNPPPYIVDLNSHMLQLYSGGVFEGVSKADGVSQRIENPFPNILGAAQPTTFQESLTTEFIESGFLGRFMLLRGNDDYHGKPFGTFKGSDKNPIIPERLIQLLSPMIGTWNSALNNGLGFKPNSIEIPVTQSGAVAVSAYFTKLADMRTALDKKGQQSLSAVISKNREKMVKLAMLHALTTNISKPEVNEASIKWATAVLALADETMQMSTSKMTSNEVHKTNHKFMEVMEKAGTEGISKSELLIRTRWLKPNDRNAIIQELIESNELTHILVKSTGRPASMYYLTKYAPKKEG